MITVLKANTMMVDVADRGKAAAGMMNTHGMQQRSGTALRQERFLNIIFSRQNCVELWGGKI